MFSAKCLHLHSLLFQSAERGPALPAGPALPHSPYVVSGGQLPGGENKIYIRDRMLLYKIGKPFTPILLYAAHEILILASLITNLCFLEKSLRLSYENKA